MRAVGHPPSVTRQGSDRLAGHHDEALGAGIPQESGQEGPSLDLTALVHHPKACLQAHLDLGGRTLLPIHNSTFDLAFHDWFEPMERLHHIAKGVRVSVSTPVFGEPVSPISAAETQTWWRDVSEAYNSTPLSFEQASPTLMTPA